MNSNFRVSRLRPITLTVNHLQKGRDMKCEFVAIIEQDADGFFVACVPELKGCHTQGKSLGVVMKRIREAIELCLEVKAVDSP